MCSLPWGAVSSDQRRPGEILADQRRALARYLSCEVAPLSRHYGPVLERTGLRGGLASLDELARIPLTEPAELTDQDAVVLRPRDGNGAVGSLELRGRILWARLTRGPAHADREIIEPLYKPVQWIEHGGYLLGYTAEDLERLADLGRRWLQLAGLRRADRLLNVLAPAAGLPHWQLVLGCRRAGVAATHLGAPPDEAALARLSPTVLAGTPGDVERTLEVAARSGRRLAHLRTVLVAGAPPPADADRAHLAGLAGVDGDLAVVAAWAPPGARAVWAECRTGDALHTWPDSEVVEVVDPGSGRPVAEGQPGELVWTALGWRGTVLLRLRTGERGALVRSVPCATCGRGTPRVRRSTGVAGA